MELKSQRGVDLSRVAQVQERMAARGARRDIEVRDEDLAGIEKLTLSYASL